MIYLFQRIIQNHFQWTRPSPGRLGPAGEGQYVKDNGFGHEDWNFNKNLTIDGNMYGYCYYHPAPAKQDNDFNIAFATYTNNRWYLVGFYLNTKFIHSPPKDKNILLHKMNDLNQLGQSLGQRYKKLKIDRFLKELENEASYLNWRVSPDNAIRTLQPIPIPKEVFNTRNFRIGRPTEISKNVFESLFTTAQEGTVYEDYGIENEFPEGMEVESRHRLRERNQAVIKTAKNIHKQKFGKLFCQTCGFDFQNVYGDVGLDYIEGHHTVPLSQLTGKTVTKVTDIALVCSNCHRMLHRRRPWLDMKQLKDLVKKK